MSAALLRGPLIRCGSALRHHMPAVGGMRPGPHVSRGGAVVCSSSGVCALPLAYLRAGVMLCPPAGSSSPAPRPTRATTTTRACARSLTGAFFSEWVLALGGLAGAGPNDRLGSGLASSGSMAVVVMSQAAPQGDKRGLKYSVPPAPLSPLNASFGDQRGRLPHVRHGSHLWPRIRRRGRLALPPLAHRHDHHAQVAQGSQGRDDLLQEGAGGCGRGNKGGPVCGL